MDIAIERYDSARHDPEVVARLIYQADPSLMRFVFGDEHRAVPIIARLVGGAHNDYAGSRVTCAVHDGGVIGVMAGLTGAEKAASAKPSGKEWGAALGLRGMARALRWGPKLERVSTTDLAADEFYISALTVDDRYQGRGIGSQLLAEALRDHDTVVTDVNIDKADALRFYERHGFEAQGEMVFEHEGRRLGNHQIRRTR